MPHGAEVSRRSPDEQLQKNSRWFDEFIAVVTAADCHIVHECAAFRRSRIQWRRSSRVLLLAASSGEHVLHIREGSRALLYRHPHTPSWRSRRPHTNPSCRTRYKR